MKTLKIHHKRKNKKEKELQEKEKGSKTLKSLIIISVLSWIILLSSCFPIFRHSDHEGKRHHNERQEHHEEHHDNNNDRH